MDKIVVRSPTRACRLVFAGLNWHLFHAQDPLPRCRERLYAELSGLAPQVRQKATKSLSIQLVWFTGKKIYYDYESMRLAGGSDGAFVLDGIRAA